MADDNEDLQADEELPAPAEDSFEQLENDSPAERSGHVAVTDGRCMYVWGGYKVGGHHPQALRVRLGGYKVHSHHPQALHLRLGGLQGTWLSPTGAACTSGGLQGTPLQPMVLVIGSR